ncbi:hypothetical protein N7492_000822 [Penicillium capsulatum]|uniref:Uncharacterized protein n=1 Tax=Penicillium capsulatum TaxID=69766 RepID=A0A9W9LYW3_9EURO|nr:hypothetical protein N7492_000822 [Penicillium capsulatum]KAJ6130119.1 hypothetical protein N7512_002899 [Penicillium capsulatum]
MAQPTELFQRLRQYSFEADPEFANGLAIILGHPETPASEAEMKREDDLVLQAKCFFFSRKEKITPAINFPAYKSWLTAQSSEEPAPATAPTEASAVPPEPSYPSSFAHIVELITTGQPIPGIQQIPDTVLTGHDITSDRPRRRKPWETDNEPATESEPTSNSA